MKKLVLIFAFLMMAAIGHSQKPEVFNRYDKTVTITNNYGANILETTTMSVYGKKVRLITDYSECPNVTVCFVKYGEPHSIEIDIVDHKPVGEQWQFVTQKGEEDFTIRIESFFYADMIVYVRSGNVPKAEKKAK